MATITYSNKVAVNTNSGVADINKVNAADMNEIKTVVNNNYSEYSNKTTEIKNDIFYITGDTFSATDIVAGGHITSSSSNVQFSIPLSKNTANITSATITNLTARLRGISGYLNNNSSATNYVGLSGYTISSTIQNNMISINITKSSAFTNITNNTPISVYIDSISVSFS